MEEQRARKKQRKVLAAAEDHNAEYDLLSRLPEHLIHCVLSRLRLQEILKAHAVCKSWRRIFSSFPKLVIGFADMVGEEPDMGNKEYMVRRVERIARFVDVTMTRFQDQHLKVGEFGIYYPNFGDKRVCLSRIARWTTIALDHNAREISIELSDWVFGYLNKTIEPSSLHLSGYNNNLLLRGSGSLRALSLSGFEAGEFLSWPGLMSAFLSLQPLSLDNCHLKDVRISGLPKLKSLSITQCESTRLVEIQAPSLESFRFHRSSRSKRRGATQEQLAKASDGMDVKGLLWTPHPDTVTVVPASSGDDFLQVRDESFDTEKGRRQCLCCLSC